MFKVVPYIKANGESFFDDLVEELDAKSKTDKMARIRLKKIVEYVTALEAAGTYIGFPKVKHLRGKLWELRPTSDRVLFAYAGKEKFVLLHHFVKTTNKTPILELEQAERNLKDYLERFGE